MIDQELKQIANQIIANGGKPFLVGGAVRDMVIGKASKDLDVEAFGITSDDLISVLGQFGKVDTVGASFGVIKLTTEKNDFDFSLPRRESKSGKGHKGFIVQCDHKMTPKEAAARRDFTWNALMLDLSNMQIVDFFNGQNDLQKGIIKATSEHFSEDALRVLRGMQFAGRFELSRLDKETVRMCKSLKSEFKDLAKERIWIEFEKWASKSTMPSLGLEFLRQTEWVELFPELANLIGLEQNPKWHPEGDVFQHTKQVVDKCAKIAIKENLGKLERTILILAGLCHDFGKVNTTITKSNGEIGSPKHAKASVEIARKFLQSIDAPKCVTSQVLALVENHMFRAVPNKRNVRRLSKRIEPSNIQMLVWLMQADSVSKPFPTDNSDKILEIASQLHCESKAIQPILMGRHLLEHKLMSPGPEMGKMLQAAFQAQLDGEFSTVEQGIVWARKRNEQN